MSEILAFDPGKRCVGWAAFGGGRLVRCGLVAAVDHAALTGALAERFEGVFAPGAPGTRAAIEWPQVYNARGRKGDQADIVEVAAIAGVLRHLCRYAERIDQPWPHDWKGSAPKAVMLDRIRQRLDNDELAEVYRQRVPAGLRHNLIDAVGVGLWASGRLR